MRARPFLLATAVALIGAGASAQERPFRDLNRNGTMDPYENPALPPERRADDLVRRMTVEEKVGAMMHGSLASPAGLEGPTTRYDMDAARKAIVDRNVNSLITRLSIAPADLARENNRIQALAATTRLGIPVTISTDPRNHFQVTLGASNRSLGFSQWPETLGFAAIGDPALVRRFGDIARQEYRAVGIHMALSPQADLATEPRWSRQTGTFGSDPDRVSALTGAYVEGFQHGRTGLARDGVATIVKHWVGYGAAPEGFDGHNRYGRTLKLDQASFAQHIRAFQGAFRAGAAGVMPTYGIVTGVTAGGRPLQPVGAGFNAYLIQDLLRRQQGFEGVVISDWGITNDCGPACAAPTREQPQTPAAIAMPWGVETLSKRDRFALAVNAGEDQLGGVDDPTSLLEAVRAGKVTEARLDASVRRIMLLKFRLGLFDNPMVDPDAAARVAGSPAFQREADAAQRRAEVLLENRGGLLPLAPGKRVFARNVSADAVRAAGLIPVGRAEDADVVLIRGSTPFEQIHPYHFFGQRQHEGRLDFRAGDPDYDALVAVGGGKPVIFAVDMDRPAILGDVARRARAILALFGASDAALLDVVTGRAVAEGRLPFELPASMTAAAAQDPARSDDSAAPAYRVGAGLGGRR